MKTSESIGKLAEALAKAQGEILAVTKDRDTDFTTKTGTRIRYSYADLASVWDACRIPLSKNGLAVVQAAETLEKAILLTTRIAHVSGEWIESALTMAVADTSPQTVGSAITYARRYALSGMVGVVAEEDDDGAAAQGHTKPNSNGNPTPHAATSTDPKGPRDPNAPASGPQKYKVASILKANGLSMPPDFKLTMGQAHGIISVEGDPAKVKLALARVLQTSFIEPKTETGPVAGMDDLKAACEKWGFPWADILTVKPTDYEVRKMLEVSGDSDKFFAAGKELVRARLLEGK